MPDLRLPDSWFRPIQAARSLPRGTSDSVGHQRQQVRLEDQTQPELNIRWTGFFWSDQV